MRIGPVDRPVPAFISVDQGGQDVEAGGGVAVRRRFAIEIRGNFGERPVLIGLRAQWADVHVHGTVSAPILSYSACVPTDFISTRLNR